MPYIIEPPRYNSQCIDFSEWISLLTLCLAPLIVHLLAGHPPVSYLAHNRPPWYDRLCHYNPTSIIWRYAAITDRRIRAIRWSKTDFAATNAIFWTTEGWDGGEHMVVDASPHCFRYPDHTRTGIFTLTMLQTIITVLQGVSAMYALIGSLAGLPNLNFNLFMGVDQVFFPIAILGLLRLFPAVWLTEDFVYTIQTERPVQPLTQCFPVTDGRQGQSPITPKDPLDVVKTTIPEPESHFKSTSYWPSRIFRIFYLLFLLGVWGLALVFVTSIRDVQGLIVATTTVYLVALLHLIFLSVSIVLYTYYFYRGSTTTTLLPCISSNWYRLYTIFIMSFTVVLIIIASVETNKDPAGRYTSAAPRTFQFPSSVRGQFLGCVRCIAQRKARYYKFSEIPN
ncbi:hypothetical protein BDV95DRAFT_678972 [Massariosphaeria phaeospora]|uniref:Uncharacterized protein n=1 Tax=Massariosphaeria phaeospora TaxID=100035 RepID=A0A7C8I181_9PLEO|nr:hypothetical protein BDV95DRAFT_678972 [Massariosphaeria phaeospora]